MRFFHHEAYIFSSPLIFFKNNPASMKSVTAEDYNSI
jgi:hypothetical protein